MSPLVANRCDSRHDFAPSTGGFSSAPSLSAARNYSTNAQEIREPMSGLGGKADPIMTSCDFGF
jgi:hypothetical protein